MDSTVDRKSTAMECDIQPVSDHKAYKQDESESKQASWLALFHFMSRSHIIIFTSAIVLSIASGVVIPALAVFLGRIFDLFTSFGAGQISGPDLVEKVTKYGIALAGLGSASGLLNATFFGLWVLFGELRVKSMREKLFEAMLGKDLEWYDMRKAGIETLIVRQQTYVRLTNIR